MSNPIEVEKSWLEGLVKYVKRTEMGIQQAMKDGDTETIKVVNKLEVSSLVGYASSAESFIKPRGKIV